MKIICKNIIKGSYFLITFILCSCGSGGNDQIVFNKIVSTQVHFIEKLTGVSQPIDMFKKDNSLFISDYRGDSLLCVYSIEGQKIMNWLLPKGLEDNEFQSPIQVKLLSNGQLFVNNRWHYSAGKYILDPLNKNTELIGEKITVNTDIDMLYPIAVDFYVASGRFAQGRYALLNNCGEIIDYFGSYPTYKKGEEKIANTPKFMFHQTIFSQNPEDNNLLASLSSHTLDIFDISDINNPKEISHTLFSKYDYFYQHGADWASVTAKDDVEAGAISISVSGNYIYILYSPSILTGKNKVYKMNEVWVFSWDGTPIKKYLLDTYIGTIYIDNDIVYCTTLDSPPALTYFKI